MHIGIVKRLVGMTRLLMMLAALLGRLLADRLRKASPHRGEVSLAIL